mmetsp:Transcript_72750/g.171133  ORF Transcript_72750/g.171133 Transcript_72750/m.171133 type:complete len:218 (-) Transcript_72750:98-751(-)
MMKSQWMSGRRSGRPGAAKRRAEGKIFFQSSTKRWWRRFGATISRTTPSAFTCLTMASVGSIGEYRINSLDPGSTGKRAMRAPNWAPWNMKGICATYTCFGTYSTSSVLLLNGSKGCLPSMCGNERSWQFLRNGTEATRERAHGMKTQGMQPKRRATAPINRRVIATTPVISAAAMKQIAVIRNAITFGISHKLNGSGGREDGRAVPRRPFTMKTHA